MIFKTDQSDFLLQIKMGSNSFRLPIGERSDIRRTLLACGQPQCIPVFHLACLGCCSALIKMPLVQQPRSSFQHQLCLQLLPVFVLSSLGAFKGSLQQLLPVFFTTKSKLIIRLTTLQTGAFQDGLARFELLMMRLHCKFIPPPLLFQGDVVYREKCCQAGPAGQTRSSGSGAGEEPLSLQCPP